MNKIEHRQKLFNSLGFTCASQDIAVSPYWTKALVTVPLNNINNNVTSANEIDKSPAISEDLALKVKPQSSYSMSKLFTAIIRVLSTQGVSKHD